jgi:3-deoxy-D-manno-octulosonate 8-phosphate phosphatase (KDO 8-P phosphatase)
MKIFPEGIEKDRRLKHQLLSTVRLVAFDFDGVFTDNTVYVSEDGRETVRCWRSDGLGIGRLKHLGIEVFVISSEINDVIAARATKLGIPFLKGVEDKEAAIISTCEELRINPLNTVFVGNDINDIPAFQTVGIPIGVADAYPEIYPYIRYLTQKPGGRGAVREVCDLVFNANKVLQAR